MYSIYGTLCIAFMEYVYLQMMAQVELMVSATLKWLLEVQLVQLCLPALWESCPYYSV